MILPISYIVGVQLPAYFDEPACIGYVVPGSAAEQAGFIAGDCITGVNNISVDSWNNTNKVFVGQAGASLAFQVTRQGAVKTLEIDAENDSLEGMQALGLLPRQAARIGGLAADMPAAKAGLEKNDLILSIAGTPVTSWYDLKGIIQEYGQQPVSVVIERSGEQVSVDVVPEQREETGDFLLGIAPLQSSQLKTFCFY